MSQTNNLTSQQQISLSKRMLVGGGIGLFLISLFLLSVRSPDPSWGKFWIIKSMLIVPLAGAMGGLCNYFIIQFHKQVGLNKIVAIILSVIVFIIGLWLGTVLGLNGILWN